MKNSSNYNYNQEREMEKKKIKEYFNHYGFSEQDPTYKMSYDQIAKRLRLDFAEPETLSQEEAYEYINELCFGRQKVSSNSLTLRRTI